MVVVAGGRCRRSDGADDGRSDGGRRRDTAVTDADAAAATVAAISRRKLGRLRNDVYPASAP